MTLTNENPRNKPSYENQFEGSLSQEGAQHPVVLDEFSMKSEPGNERLVMERVASVAEENHLKGVQLERLKTAVSEAALNAIEHGNDFKAEIPVDVKVILADGSFIVQVTDQGGDKQIPDSTHPDLDAKLAGLQSPRGWGLFLIKNMVDEMNIQKDANHHTIELIFKMKEEPATGESM